MTRTVTSVSACIWNVAKRRDLKSTLVHASYTEIDHALNVPGQSNILWRPTKKDFFLEEVKNQQHIEELWGDGERNPAPINLDTASLVELWRKRLNGLSKLTDRLRGQRNKVFTHSDREALDYGGLVEKLPITYGDMQRIIDFALDVTIEMNAAVSGVVWPRLMGGSNDLRGLLNYVNAGMGWVERAVS